MSQNCPFCGSFESSTGYGFAAGPLGIYTYCGECEELIAFSPDLDGADQETADRVRKWVFGLELRLEEAREKSKGD